MFGMRELIAYLAQFEISPRRAMEVFRAFGPGAMQAIAAKPLSALRGTAAAGFPPRGQHCPVLPHGRRLRPAAGSGPSAHPAPQRGQRPHLPAPCATAGNGIQLHPPAAGKAGPCAGPVHRDRGTLREDVRRRAVYLPAGPAGRRAGHCRPAGHAGQAGQERRPGPGPEHAGAGTDPGLCLCAAAAGSHPQGHDRELPCAHRRPRHRQDHHGQRHPAIAGKSGRAGGPLCAPRAAQPNG